MTATLTLPDCKQNYQIKGLFRSLSFLSVSMVESSDYTASHSLLLPFLREMSWRNSFKDKIQTTIKRIIFIQAKRRKMQQLNAYKVQVLNRVWDREVNNIRMEAMKSKDKKVKKFVSEVATIKDEVKEVLLKNYLMRCSLRHALAFFQWRYKWKEVENVRITLLHAQLFNIIE